VAFPPARPQDNGWDFIDSMDVGREWDGWSNSDIADPPKGGEGYPRLKVENRVYCSRVFRKLHLEVAARQDGLQVLHMVLYPRWAGRSECRLGAARAWRAERAGWWLRNAVCGLEPAPRGAAPPLTCPPPRCPPYPRYDYDLPILALDLVVAGGSVTLAVADACPLSSNLTLPQHYMKTMVELQVGRQYGRAGAISSARGMDGCVGCRSANVVTVSEAF
jgi:hypothetical protein